MIFNPVAKEAPFETLGYYDLWNRRAQKRFPNGNFNDATNANSHDLQTWNRLLEEEAQMILGGLRQGSLPAYVHVEAEGLFYRVPPEHWQDGDTIEGSPGEGLFCWGSSDVPAKFHDLPLFFFSDEVEKWERALSNQHWRDALEEAGDLATFDDCIARAANAEEGYWGPFTTWIWVATRDEKITGGAQIFEDEREAALGLLHSSSVGLVLDSWLAKHGHGSLRDAETALWKKLEADRMSGAVATERRTGKTDLVPRHLWTKWAIAHQPWGLELIPDFIDFKFPSEAVRECFPRPTASRAQAAPETTARPPDRQARTVTLQQRRLSEFLSLAEREGLESSTHDQLYARYVPWNVKQNKGLTTAATYGISAFKKWRKRWREGERWA